MAAAAPPVLVGAGTASFESTPGASFSPSLPTGWARDDILLLLFTHTASNGPLAAPSGWTSIISADNGSAQHTELWWRRATPSETAPVLTLVTNSVSSVRGARVYAVRGCPTTRDPFDPLGTSVQPNATASATVAFPNPSTASDNELALAFGAYAADPLAVSTMAGWTQPSDGIQGYSFDPWSGSFTVPSADPDVWSGGPTGPGAALFHQTHPVGTAGPAGAAAVTVSGGTSASAVSTAIVLALIPAPTALLQGSARPQFVMARGSAESITIQAGAHAVAGARVGGLTTVTFRAAASLRTLASRAVTAAVGAVRAAAQLVGMPITNSGQTAPIVSDITIGGWTNETGGPDLPSSIDEPAPPVDTDYIQSSPSPVGDTCLLRFAFLNAPGQFANEYVAYRVGKSAAGGDQIDLVVTLYAADGVTPIASWTEANLGALNTVQHALTDVQIESIPPEDYTTGLVLGFQAVLVGPSTAPRSAVVTWAQLTVPRAVGKDAEATGSPQGTVGLANVAGRGTAEAVSIDTVLATDAVVVAGRQGTADPRASGSLQVTAFGQHTVRTRLLARARLENQGAFEISGGPLPVMPPIPIDLGEIYRGDTVKLPIWTALLRNGLPVDLGGVTLRFTAKLDLADPDADVTTINASTEDGSITILDPPDQGRYRVTIPSQETHPLEIDGSFTFDVQLATPRAPMEIYTIKWGRFLVIRDVTRSEAPALV